jgi:hypothetical protein
MVPFSLTPRYRLEDSDWLQGIDPVKHYWIAINGDSNYTAAIAGLEITSSEGLRQLLWQLRRMRSGEQIQVNYRLRSLSVYCVNPTCFALQASFRGAPVWHLFDPATLENLLKTSHPEWQCTQSDIELGRNLLKSCWEQGLVA